MAKLARKLRLADYFALAFGTMVGVGWLVLMDEWLGRGGPLGAILGFALGGILLLPVGYVYGQWVQRLPDAAGEAAYTAQIFPPIVSYFTGWMMLLAYFIVCPWEAVAVGKLAVYIFPSLNSFELYRVAGQPVFLPRLVLGIALTLFLALLNYRGIRLSANFQNWTTTLVLLLFVALLGISAVYGAPANFRPAFQGAPWISIVLTLQIVPYFMTGFESAPKVAEEAHLEFPSTGFFRAIAMALFVGAGFYVLAIAAVAYVAPWQGLLGKHFVTAIAFEQALGARWPVRLILLMAMFGLFQCFNGNFVASSRLLFAYGRRRTINCRNYRRNVGGRSARRRATCAGHGSRVDGLCVGLDGCLRVVLAGGKTDFHARRDGSRHHGLVAALSYESLTHYSGPLFACRMDRIGHLASPRRHPPHSKLIKALVYTFEANHFAIDDPFPPSWTTDDSHLWPHGRDRTARCGLHSASGFQSPARATAELQFEQERKI